MIRIKGRVENGVVKPEESLAQHEGKQAVVMIAENDATTSDERGLDKEPGRDDVRASLSRIFKAIEDNHVETGIGDRTGILSRLDL